MKQFSCSERLMQKMSSNILRFVTFKAISAKENAVPSALFSRFAAKSDNYIRL